jgi:fibrillarin-like rRNA methylase
MDVAKETCKEKTNINYIIGDAYSDDTYKNFPKYFDLVVIDCIHQYNQVILDINRALSFMNPDRGVYILFDDYSHPGAPEVKQAIDHSINNGLKFEKHIGHNKGHTITRSNGSKFTLNGPEGIILSYGI